MKVCKKCKKQVANKSKICKYCGADVTKSKIIKKDAATSTKKTGTKNKTAVKKPVVEKKQVVEKKPVVEKKQTVEKKTDNKKKDIIEKEKKSDVKKKDLVKKNLKTAIEKVKLKDKDKTKTKSKEKDKSKPKTKAKNKTKKNKKSDVKIKVDSKQVLSFLKVVGTGIASGFKKIGVSLVSLFAGILYGLSYGVEFISNALSKTIDFIVNLFVGIGLAIKKGCLSLKVKLTDIFAKRKVKNRIKKRNAKIARINHKNAKNARKEDKLKKLTEVEIQPLDLPEHEVKERRMLKPILITVFVLGFFGGFSLLGLDVYRYFSGTGNSIATVSQKATRDKVFTMKDVISYNDVDYRVMKVETSMGNSYKAPKEGNQFLIVTVYIRNNSSKKVPYSYENWTMSNSKGEEKKRFFSSINVDDALYSGELVIGGIKTGSMVFEQPINDNNLKMNYYELKVDENGNEVLDQAKRVFSVSIKVPENKKDDAKEDTKTKEVATTKKVS